MTAHTYQTEALVPLLLERILTHSYPSNWQTHGEALVVNLEAPLLLRSLATPAPAINAQKARAVFAPFSSHGRQTFRFQLPDTSVLPSSAQNACLSTLVQTLSASNVMQLFASLLLERRIFVGRHTSWLD